MKARRDIPTVAQSVQAWIEDLQAEGHKSIPTHVSVMRGASGRLHGKAAAGPALAQSELGPQPLYRVSGAQLKSWFRLRHPLEMADSTVKRGMSSMRSWLRFCVDQGWIEQAVMDAAVFETRASRAREEWLEPEQMEAINALLVGMEYMDDYRLFAWDLLATTGIRSFEAGELLVSSLSRREHVVRIERGKGRGDGKARKIPVDAAFEQRWAAHVERFGLLPSQHVLFARKMVFEGGLSGPASWQHELSRPASAQVLRHLCQEVSAEIRLAVRRGQFDPELAPEFEITPKVLRKTFACTQYILDKLNLGGMGLAELRQALGHSSLATTQVYLANVDEFLGRETRPVHTLDATRLIVDELRRLRASA